MVDLLVRITEDQHKALSRLPITFAESVRRGIDMYLASLEPKTSQSASKAGDNDGK